VWITISYYVTDRVVPVSYPPLKAIEIPEVTETENSEKYQGAVCYDVEIRELVRHLQG